MRVDTFSKREIIEKIIKIIDKSELSDVLIRSVVSMGGGGGQAGKISDQTKFDERLQKGIP